MVRMTITVDERLVNEVKRLSGAHTKRGAIEAALEAYARRLRQRRLLEHAGKISLSLTQNDLRRWREGR
ncbi:MAG: type II toxin-antitoxin system VapB family antitoxin [bacterium]